MKNTQLIRYNLKHRGRNHTGQPRNFNIRAICDAINSPECQETVATRGMIGYYGHIPRMRYGLRPVEGGIESSGRYAPVTPAFVTTHLRAHPDGTIEHRAEFLDTVDGRLASALWDEKVGGFSSAIDEEEPAFHGFDYVTQPNYLANSFRGIALDDVSSGKLNRLTYDDVYAAEQHEQMQGQQVLLDRMRRERDKLRAENEQLMSMIVKGGDTGITLDTAGHIATVSVSIGQADRMRQDAELFHATDKLPAFVEPKRPEEPFSLYDHMLCRFSKGQM